MPLPTTDKDVKKRLRELGHPICLFGEDAGDRRERLRAKVVEYMLEKGEAPAFCMRVQTEAAKEERASEEVFYTEGTELLK